MHIYRVIVRGRFDALDPGAAAALRDELERVDELDTYRFSREGTFTVDRRLHFWSVRVEVRVAEDSPDPKATAFELATAIASQHLERRGATGTHLRLSGSAMADVWS